MIAMNELLPLYDATEMRALDAAAIGLGIPAAVLMERAGLGAAHEVMSRFPDRQRFAVVAGTGNNGGDGFVVARHLLAAGLEPELLLTGPATKLSPESHGNLVECALHVVGCGERTLIHPKHAKATLIRRAPQACKYVLRREGNAHNQQFFTPTVDERVHPVAGL